MIKVASVVVVLLCMCACVGNFNKPPWLHRRFESRTVVTYPKGALVKFQYEHFNKVVFIKQVVGFASRFYRTLRCCPSWSLLGINRLSL